MRHKHVIHVGFGGHTNDLRAKCRHRIDLGKDRVFRRMQRVRVDSGGETTTKPTSGQRGGGSRR